MLLSQRVGLHRIVGRSPCCSSSEKRRVARKKGEPAEVSAGSRTSAIEPDLGGGHAGSAWYEVQLCLASSFTSSTKGHTAEESHYNVHKASDNTSYMVLNYLFATKVRVIRSV